MAKCKYKDVKFRQESLDLIERCNAIIVEYTRAGYRLTLRQLYYQLVTVNAITNEERSYKRLSALLTDARYAGLVDWDAIEDRVRQPRTSSEWSDINSIVESAIYSYRLPRWNGQSNYVELWVEKEALAGVLAPIARKYHITLMVNKGYSSASAMRESALRFQRELDFPRGSSAYHEHRERKLTLLYLGDHDPSGEDMVRDIRDRFLEFGTDVDVKKVALTIRQVRRYDPPPNPAKITDPRAEGYIEKYGNSSWEVDALPPSTLTQLIEDELDALIDRSLMDAIIAREDEDKELLRSATAEIMMLQRSPMPWLA